MLLLSDLAYISGTNKIKVPYDTRLEVSLLKTKEGLSNYLENTYEAALKSSISY
jgi:hypothetical protein